MTLTDLHFLRPEFFWGFIPLVLCVALLARQQLSRHSWQQSVDPELLPFLLEGRTGSKRWWTPIWLFLLGTLLIGAMTGPSVTKVQIPVIKQQHAAVIVMDLSISMYAEDVKPSRLKQTHFYIADLLRARKEGQTGLIAYTADAFVVAPLTDDTNTLLNLLPTLEPTTMPMGGSNPLAGIKAAETLLANATAGVGHIIVVSDGIVESQLDNLSAAIKSSPHRITVLGVGTDEGAPIPSVQGGFYKEENGNMIIASLNESLLKKLCRESGCGYRELKAGANVKDLAKTELTATAEENATVQRDFDTWEDGGYWLAVLALPLCLLAFRRGWLICLPLVMVLQPETAMASDWQQRWQNLWQTADQQAAQTMNSDPAEAATQFESPRWRAAAQYRAEDYQAAAESWSEFDDADGHYNRGNALAKSGQLEDALTAYNKALEYQPEMQDALRNKSLVEELLKQQEQNQEQNQEQQQQDQQNQDQQSDQDQQQGDSEQGGQGSEDKQQQQDGSDQQSQDQQKQEQPSGDQQNSNQGDQQSERDEQESQQASQGDANKDQREQQQAQAKAEQEQAAREAEQQKTQEQQSAEAAQMKQSDEQAENSEQAAMAVEQAMDSEEQQELKQWLRKIPDDPSGLLRRKFESQSSERRARQQLPELENVAPY